MPPKKKGGKKKGKGKGGDAGDGAPPLKEVTEMLMYKSECQSLQLQLAERTINASHAMAEKKVFEDRYDEVEKKLDSEEKTTHDITQAMTRQYEAMQEQLIEKINALESSLTDLKDKLDETEFKHKQTIRAKDDTIRLKDKEIEGLKEKMEDMSKEFGDMLKETLTRMRDRIEMSSHNKLEADSGVPISKQMEEFM